MVQVIEILGFAGHTATHDMQVLSVGEVYDRLAVAYVVGLEAALTQNFPRCRYR